MTAVIPVARDGFFGRVRLPAARRAPTSIGTAVARLSMMLALWHERACQRRHLLSLGDAALKDFAASRADAGFEGAKPFWRS